MHFVHQWMVRCIDAIQQCRFHHLHELTNLGPKLIANQNDCLNFLAIALSNGLHHHVFQIDLRVDQVLLKLIEDEQHFKRFFTRSDRPKNVRQFCKRLGVWKTFMQ